MTIGSADERDITGFTISTVSRPPLDARASGTQKRSVGSTELRPSRRGLLKKGELVAEGQDLGPSAEAGPNRRSEALTLGRMICDDIGRAGKLNGPRCTGFSVGTGYAS
jgi:hypothetical protein